MANNPYVNKVVFGDEVLIDTSEVTVDETSLEAGRTALNAAGALIRGTRQFVSGVKGDKESSYRTGNVNLTPANIGALPLSGGTMTGGINFSDSSSHLVGGVSYVHDTNSTDRTYLVARTLDGSSNIQLGVKRNGDNSLSYHITNPAKFRQDAGITPANIGAAYAINIASSVSEWSGIFQALDVLPTYTPGIIYAGSGPASKLTSGKLTSYINGIVTRMSENVFDFMVQSGANPTYMYSFRVTGLTSSAGTP